MDDTLNFNEFHQEVLKDNFAKFRKPTSELVKINTDFTSNILAHVQTATYWDNMIEPVIRMDKLHTKLKTWKVDDSFLSESEIFDMDRFMKLSQGSTENIHLSREADQFLSAHIGKIATQWWNLRHELENNAFALVSKSQWFIIPQILGGPKTAAKQLSSIADTAAYAGTKNAMSGWRGMTNLDNLSVAMKDAGYLADRMPPWLTNEGEGALFATKGNLKLSTRASIKRQEFLSMTFGNLIKTTDWFASFNAWLSGMSKYLDEVHPNVHKAWASLNLSDVKAKLSPQEYRDAIAASEKFMTKIMGSTHAVDQWVGSQSILSKGVFFLWKTGLNHTMYLFEQAKYIFGKNPNIGWWQRAAHAASMAISIASTYAYWKALDYTFNKVDVYFGTKTEEEVGKYRDIKWRIIEDPSFWRKVYEETTYAMNMMFISPSAWLSLTEGYQGLITQWEAIVKAPTVARKAEELAYLTVGWLGWVNQFYTNFARKELSDASGKDFTKVGNKEYDSIVSSIIKDVEDNGGKLPTWDKMQKLIDTQRVIKKSSAEVSANSKAKKDSKELFIDWFKSKYGENFTKADFGSYIKDNKDWLKNLGITKESEVISLLTSAELTRAKSKWEENSLLMGKPAQVIFDVKVKPYLDNWDKEGAKEELKRLMKEWVVKNQSWAEQIARLILSY